jgi:hypothetical protein
VRLNYGPGRVSGKRLKPHTSIRIPEETQSRSRFNSRFGPPNEFSDQMGILNAGRFFNAAACVNGKRLDLFNGICDVLYR